MINLQYLQGLICHPPPKLEINLAAGGRQDDKNLNFNVVYNVQHRCIKTFQYENDMPLRLAYRPLAA